MVQAAFAASASISASSSPTMEKGFDSQPAGDILISESSAGTITTDTVVSVHIFSIGVVYSEKPVVSVQHGDIEILSSSLPYPNDTFTFTIKTASTVPSTIKISSIAYNISSEALYDYVTVKVTSDNGIFQSLGTTQNGQVIQQAQTYGSISGTVSWTSTPCSGTVKAYQIVTGIPWGSGNEHTTKFDAVTGAYRITNLKPDFYVLEFVPDDPNYKTKIYHPQNGDESLGLLYAEQVPVYSNQDTSGIT